MRARVVVPARNEGRRLARLLLSLERAMAYARAHGTEFEIDVVVVLDRCTDASRDVATSAGVRCIDCPAPFGKVEALRAGMHDAADFHVCVDADVTLGEHTLYDLLATLASDPALLAACPPLCPEALEGPHTPLAWALHRYNRARGFSSERLWLSGRCYAVRGAIAFPTPTDMHTRVAQMAPTRLRPELEGPLLADDIWLSRALLAQNGASIRHIHTDAVRYRAPSTLRGMSRTWRRLRRELRRIDLLFPELPREMRDRHIDGVHGARDALALAIFRAALYACRIHAFGEEWLAVLSGRRADPWPVVEESKT